MEIHYYLSLIPESLIASHLSPDQFGNYYAVGSHKRSRGQAIFFEVDPALIPNLDTDWVARTCVPHEDGTPRKSTYIRIYRALELVPVAALVRLYLTTEDGRVLGIDAAPWQAETGRPLHLYQELCPVTPRVVSKLNPRDFAQRLTDPRNPVSVPRIVFAEMKLGPLAANPDAPDIDNLPYANLDHLRDCLRELHNRYAKPTKVAMRQVKTDFLYRTIRSGFFVGDGQAFNHYPLPGQDALETKYYAWWRSAQASFGA
jgi:hypothetical protein